MRSTRLSPFFFLILFLTIGWVPAFAQRTLSQMSSDPRLKAAFDLMERRNFQAAMLEFNQFLQAGNGSDLQQTATFYSAHCALELKHPDAREQLLAVNQKFPSGLYENRVYLDLGHYYYQIRKWDSALEYYARIPSGSLDQTSQYEADFKSGVSAFQLQQYDRSKAYFLKLRSRNHPFKAAAAYYTAYLNYKDGLLDDALADLDVAAMSPEYKPLIPVLKANILYKKKAWNEVIALAEASFKDTARIANAEELHMLAGESHFNKKEYKEAAGHFETYTRNMRGTLPRGLQFRIALTMFKTDQPDKAITGFRQVAARLDTSKGKTDTLGQYASYYLGICYLKKDQKQFALTAFDQASMMKGDAQITEVAWFNAGKLSYDLEKYGDAVETLKEFAEEFPKSSYLTEANELIGEGLLNSNDFEAALRYMESSRIKSDRLSLAYQRAAYQQGTTYFNDGNNAKAIETFQNALKYPSDKEALAATHYWLGEAYQKERQYAKAAAEYQACQKVEGVASTVYLSRSKYSLGYALYNQKEYGKALVPFREYIAETEKTVAKTNLGDAILRYADCLYANREYTQALRQYDKAIDARTPDMDYAFFQKGMVYSVLKDYENARTNFSVVVEKYNRSRLYDQALFQKAQMDFESANYQAAIRGFSQIITNMPGSPVLPYCYLNRAISASNLKEYPAAVKDFKTILEQYPSHQAAENAILGLQESLVQIGDVDQINEYIGRYKMANPESNALESIEFETCKALYNNQKYEKAIAGFQDYLKNYPSSSFVPEARFYLAESQYRGGSKSEALGLYKEIAAQGRSNWLIRTTFRIGELEYANGRYAQAASQYSTLLNGLAKSNKDVNNASLGLIECLFQQARYDSVSLLTSELLKRENLSQDVANKASLYAAKVYVGKGEYEKAIDELLNTVNNAQDINGAEAQYLVGEVFFKQKKYNESLAALFELKSRFAAYPKWYNKGFLLMADNYVGQKEYFQAQATLNSIIENAKDKETIAGAKSRLAALKAEAGDELKP